MTHVYVWANRIFIVSYNGSVSPVQHQAITRTSTCINLLSIEPSGTNFSEIYSLQTYSWKTILFNTSSAKCRPFCSGLCMIILDPSLYLGFSYFHVTNFACSWVLIFHFIFYANQKLPADLPSNSIGNINERKDQIVPWFRHQMEKLSALLAFCPGNSPVTGEFPAQRPVTLSFGVFSDLRLE